MKNNYVELIKKSPEWLVKMFEKKNLAEDGSLVNFAENHSRLERQYTRWVLSPLYFSGSLVILYVVCFGYLIAVGKQMFLEVSVGAFVLLAAGLLSLMYCAQRATKKIQTVFWAQKDILDRFENVFSTLAPRGEDLQKTLPSEESLRERLLLRAQEILVRERNLLQCAKDLPRTMNITEMGGHCDGWLVARSEFADLLEVARVDLGLDISEQSLFDRAGARLEVRNML